MAVICPICHTGRMLSYGNDLVCHRCGNVVQKVETHWHPQTICYNCKNGQPILTDDGEFVCNNCGVVFPLEESISNIESDMPKKYTKVPEGRHKHIQEVAIGNRTSTIKVKTEQEENRERKQRQRQKKKK